MDLEKAFAKYVRSYNRLAKLKGLPLYSLAAAPMGRLSELLHPETLPRYMLAEDKERFRADFFKVIAEDMRPLAKIGFDRRKQQSKFGRAGAEENKNKGETNRRAVLLAAREILSRRQRAPSYRELAKLIAAETSIPVNTVRGHLMKLRKEKKLD